MPEDPDDGPDKFREAADRAREELLRQLGSEAERLDAELAELGKQIMESAARVAEERVEREIGRLEHASSELSDELLRRLSERAEQLRSVLTEQLEASGAELRAASAQCLADPHAPTADASSARRRSSAPSASVNSSRSPWRIASSRCAVSLIRWSVTRFSG